MVFKIIAIRQIYVHFAIRELRIVSYGAIIPASQDKVNDVLYFRHILQCHGKPRSPDLRHSRHVESTQPTRISRRRRFISHIPIRVCIARQEPNWVLAHEPVSAWTVVPRSVVHPVVGDQRVSIGLAASEAERVRVVLRVAATDARGLQAVCLQSDWSRQMLLPAERGTL